MNIQSVISDNKCSPDWSEAEIALLRQLYESGVINKEIAKRLSYNRTASAVRTKVYRLKLSTRIAKDKSFYQGFQVSKTLFDKIRINAAALGITRSEYARRSCERCPVDVVAE